MSTLAPVPEENHNASAMFQSPATWLCSDLLMQSIHNPAFSAISYRADPTNACLHDVFCYLRGALYMHYQED